MRQPLPSILSRIAERKRDEVAEQRRRRPLAAVRAAAEAAPPPRDFKAALTGPGVALIAEIKAASPSAGLLQANPEPIRRAQCYARAGAAALSVLTDQPFFHGHPNYLTQARVAVTLPVLAKDFFIDPYQVYAARTWGADAVLLIVALLDDARLRDLYQLTRELGMAPLVEVHTAEELERALALDPVIVGVNHRDLHTFQIDLNCSRALLSRIPKGVCRVAESGIHAPGDVRRLAAWGVDAVLVGTALMQVPDPETLARELVRAGQPHPEEAPVCPACASKSAG